MVKGLTIIKDWQFSSKHHCHRYIRLGTVSKYELRFNLWVNQTIKSFTWETKLIKCLFKFHQNQIYNSWTTFFSWIKLAKEAERAKRGYLLRDQITVDKFDKPSISLHHINKVLSVKAEFNSFHVSDLIVKEVLIFYYQNSKTYIFRSKHYTYSGNFIFISKTKIYVIYNEISKNVKR